MITTSSVAVVAHCPASGVKVYVPFAVVPVASTHHTLLIPSVDDDGSGGAVLPWHSGPMAAKSGVI